MIPVLGAAANHESTAANSPVPQARLVHAAHEFEAQMMKELLKPITGSTSLTGEDEDSSDASGSNSALGQFASDALGQALSRQGGFGIANQIIHDLSQSGSGPKNGKVTGTLHGNTVMSAIQSLK